MQMVNIQNIFIHHEESCTHRHFRIISETDVGATVTEMIQFLSGNQTGSTVKSPVGVTY